MKEKFELIEKTLNYIDNSKINLCDILVYDEITCQLDKEITDKQFEMLFCKSINAYLKDDSSNLWGIVRYCIEHIEELEELSTYTILENSYGY